MVAASTEDVAQFVRTCQLAKEQIQALENLSQDVKNVLLQSPSSKKRKLSEMDHSLKGKVGLQCPTPLTVAQIESMKSSKKYFVFLPPSDVRKNPLNFPSTKDKAAELVVVVPEELFGERDFVNCICHLKIAHYMTHCAILLKTKLEGADVQFTENVHEFLGKYITLRKEAATLRIRFVAEAPEVKRTRFSPTANNLRPVFLDLRAIEDTQSTPFYNNSLAALCLRKDLYEVVDEFFEEHPHCRGVYQVLQAWLRHVHPSTTMRQTFSDELLFGVLCQVQDAVGSSDEMLLLTEAWSWLGNLKGEMEKPVLVGTDDTPEETVKLYQPHYDYVWLFDGALNLAGNLTKEICNEVCYHARTMLQRISKSLESPSKILRATTSISTEYDQFLRISVSEAYLNSFRKKFPDYAMDAYFDASYAFSKEVAKVLTRDWADRVRYFRFLRNLPPSDTRESSSPSHQTELTIVVGVKYTIDWRNPVTRGPSADAPEAQAFRDFYGEKSQLRKFPDNAICEAVIWCDEMDEHLLESVPHRIATYLLKTSLDVPEASVTPLWSYPADAISQLSSYQKLTKAYDKLSQALRKVKLPLTVVGVTCPSAYYRQTEPFPPEAPSSPRGQASVDNVTLLLDHRKPPSFYAALDVFVSLEHSGKWGDDPVVMGQLRTAFYIEMAQALSEQYGFVAKPMESSLVLLVESTTFILGIVDEREITLLEKLEEREPKAALLKTQNAKELRKRLVQQPLVCQQLHSVGQRLSGFPGACQLVKRWLASHYLSDILEEVAIELLVAKVFLDDVRSDPPRSPFAGLCRFLELVATHDFLSQPVMVDLSDTFTKETANTALENFIKRRPVLPPLVIVTPEDTLGARYTQSGPEAIMLKRLISLASIAYSLVRSNVSRARALDFNALLVHDNSVYDFLVLLDERQLVRSRDSSSRPGKSNGRLDTVPIINYDPVERFIADIRHAYDSLALFCYDKYGGSSIGVILRPSQPRPINVSSCAGRRKSENDTALVVNKEALLEDIRIIGKGLVRDVVSQK